jgi:hypothetical protein
MTDPDLPSKLRALYVETGANYVQAAANEIEMHRARMLPTRRWISTAEIHAVVEAALAEVDADTAAGAPRETAHERYMALIEPRLDALHLSSKEQR